MDQMREKYESLSAFVLKDLAKARGLKGISSLKKGQIIDRMLEEDEKEAKAAAENGGENPSGEKVSTLKDDYAALDSYNVYFYIFESQKKTLKTKTERYENIHLYFDTS